MENKKNLLENLKERLNSLDIFHKALGSELCEVGEKITKLESSEAVANE